MNLIVFCFHYAVNIFYRTDEVTFSIICNDLVDLKDRFDVSSHELSPFLITIILTTANDEILYKDARPMIQKYFVIHEITFIWKNANNKWYILK